MSKLAIQAMRQMFVVASSLIFFLFCTPVSAARSLDSQRASVENSQIEKPLAVPRAETQCVAAALTKILEEVQNEKSPRDKWRIEFELQRSSGRVTSLRIDAESIGPDLGGVLYSLMNAKAGA